MLISDGNWEKQTRKRPNKRVTYGNHFLSDRVMMMRREGHTPYSGLPTILLLDRHYIKPTILRLSHFESHAIHHPLWPIHKHVIKTFAMSSITFTHQILLLAPLSTCAHSRGAFRDPIQSHPIPSLLVTSWWPLGDHLVTTWWPLRNHFVINSGSLVDH